MPARGRGAVTQPGAGSGRARPLRPWGSRGREPREAAPTWFDFLDDGAAAPVPHLPDVQQVVGVPVVRGPEVDEDPGPAAPAVNDHPVTERRVLGVGGRQLLCPRQVPVAREGGGAGQGASAPAGDGERRGPRQPRSPLTARCAGQRGAARPSGGDRRRPPPAAAAAPRRGPGPAPPSAAAAPGTGRAPPSATTGRRRRSCGQRSRLSSGPGPAPEPRRRARLRSPGHVRRPPPARASPRCRHPAPAPAPAATSPGVPGAANRSPRSRAPPGGAPPPAAAETNRPPPSPGGATPTRPRGQSDGAEGRPHAAEGRAWFRPCSRVRPLPGDVTRKLPPASPIADFLPPATSQSEAPK